MRCPQCQHENPEGVKFCGECGLNLSRTEGADQREPLSLALLESSPIGVRISRDSDSIIVYANARILEMFRVSKEEFIGNRTEDHHTDLGKHMLRLKRFRELGSLENEEVLMKRPDGSTFWVLMSVFRYEYENEPARLSWFYDITDRKEAEKAIRFAQ